MYYLGEKSPPLPVSELQVRCTVSLHHPHGTELLLFLMECPAETPIINIHKHSTTSQTHVQMFTSWRGIRGQRSESVWWCRWSSGLVLPLDEPKLQHGRTLYSVPPGKDSCPAPERWSEDSNNVRRVSVWSCKAWDDNDRVYRWLPGRCFIVAKVFWDPQISINI